FKRPILAILPRLDMPLRAPARIIADDRDKRDSIAHGSFKFEKVITRAAITHDGYRPPAVALSGNAERHRDRIPDDAELAVPKPTIRHITQPKPDPLTEFAAIDTKYVFGFQNFANLMRHFQRMHWSGSRLRPRFSFERSAPQMRPLPVSYFET